MNSPDTGPTDEQLAMLLGTTNKDAPVPDPAVLARLRDQSLEAFQNATQSTPSSLWKRIMLPSSFRWIAASTAALVLLGIGIAHWVISSRVQIAPPDDEQFVLADVLSEDGRIGKVTDAQGIVSVMPVLHDRWTPVQPRLVLKPGDWVQTDSRGANAVSLKLLKSTNVIVGPHSTVELVKANEIRVLVGEIEVTASADEPVLLHGPDKQKLMVKGKQFFRVVKDKLASIEKEPLWLQGFKGTTANESIGSLIASVDGRNVPLTVGYHHVSIDIRDQIARTVIEESFVNRTDSVLEGVFYFPLPQDASISGFGMWIGDQLVEADVVEKERARGIYETILREKRDPGLLEWAGGNMFKARVYPIPAYAEKRIKISYTQVLPLQGNRYHYSYGLQSELLKQHPLRDLKIDLKVNSAIAIKSVSSPTHPARVAKTEHSGHVEFTAQKYTPTRDFEAVIEVEGRQSDVVLIPHRRGDDGYFMLQLTPPGGAGDWERPLIPNGEPLKLLLLADTSASLDQSQRTAQNGVIASLLAALTPRDTINVATCDVNCDWIFEKPVTATPENITSIRTVLAKRTSLGWTNLDAAFASALKMTDPTTHVIYIGDGITTVGDADPVAFSKRLERLYEGKSGTFHSVAVGSSYEPLVMKAIASLGGGSMRRVTGERGPQAAAMELLTEIATPTLRNLKVEFTGIRTARVYPEQLPNVAAGTQQILLGRYLPEGKDQVGEIVVSGMLGNKPVRFTSKIALKDAEQGNSFIPRLWARMHLDKLLEQGISDTVKQDIIALSEEFNIITPYTSLLVLESDADRERFKVKRRFQMRDGEKFFAEGRDNAVYELKQKQMKLAGDYRTELRRKVLARIQTLGRNPQLFQGQAPRKFRNLDLLAATGRTDLGELSQYDIAGLGSRLELSDLQTTELGLIREGGGSAASGGEGDHPFPEDGWAHNDSIAPREKQDAAFEPLQKTNEFGYYRHRPIYLKDSLMAIGGKKSGLDFLSERHELGLEDLRGSRLVERDVESSEFDSPPYRRGQSSRLPWLGTLFPGLATPRSEPKEPKSTWPAAALALSRSLLRSEKLAQQKGGIVIVRQTENFAGRDHTLSARSKRLELVSPTSWFTRSAPEGGQVIVSWCDAKEFGTYSTAYQLGRVRASDKLDLQNPPLGLDDDSITPLHLTYAIYTPTVETTDKDRELLTLKHKDSPDHEVRYLIDTSRHVLLAIEQRHKGKTVATTKFEDFVEIAGMWWARKSERIDADGKRQWTSTQTVAELPAADFTKRITQELEGKAKVQFLQQPLPKLADAKVAVAVGNATFDDRAVLTMHFAATQQWARALEHFQECERLAPGKVGMQWLRDAFLFASRRHEELRKRYLERGATLATTTDADLLANDRFLAEFILNQAQQVLETNEMIGLSNTLQKLYQRQPVHLHAMLSWRLRRVDFFQQAGQSEKATGLLKELAIEYPREYSLQYRYAQSLASSGDYPAADAWLNRVLVPEAKWEAYEEEYLRGLFANFLQQQGRYRDLANYLANWFKQNPDSSQSYAQYLAALVRSNQAEKAETLTAQWLREAQVPGELSRPAAARLEAAVNFALGQGYNLNSNHIQERWLAPLAEAALFFARDDAHLNTMNTILQQWRFVNTDAGLAAKKSIAVILQKETDKLSVAQISRFVDLISSGAIMELDNLQIVAAGIRKRWDVEKKPEIKHLLGQSLVRVLLMLRHDGLISFLRTQWKQGPEQHRLEYANALFARLMEQPWSPELEDEAFTMLDKLAEADEPASGLYSRIAGLYRLTDSMLDARFQAKMQTVEHQEKLTRTELQKKRDENQKLAREGFAERLRKEVAKQPKPFSNWIVAEALWLDILLERNFKQVVEDCWTILDTPAAKAKPEDHNSFVESKLDEVLRERLLTTLQNLAARKSADPALLTRLLKYVDQQMKEHPDALAHWRGEKYQLLIALDRLKDLEAVLRQWVVGPDPDNRWRLALGYLLAEQGQVAEAIKLFEIVEAADELNPAEYRTLADWYLIENKRDQRQKAQAAFYKTTDENQLGQLLKEFLHPWQRAGNLPTQLDPEVFEIFKVLFEKSTSPQNYLWQLRQFYQASRDFRMLSMLPDGVVGHTAGKVYPFLGGMRSVLDEVRDEAVADQLVERIVEVRKTAKSAIDLRALDLLELLVERRAGELLNQPGPHAAKALAALERAFKREWSPGEPRLMADFLAGLGNSSQAAIAKEQLRQLEVLHRDSMAGPFDRLHIAHRYAETLDGYSRHADAMDLLQAALKEFEDANGGILPTTVNPVLETMIAFTENAKHFDRGEKLLLTQLTHPVHGEQKNWLVRRINELYHRALKFNGEVSLGKGATLYKALEAKLLAEAAANADQNQRYQTLMLMTQLYRTAREFKIESIIQDVRTFAFKQFPPLVKEQVDNYASLVNEVAEVVHLVVGPRDGIAFVLDRFDDEPGWIRYTNQDSWSQHCHRLGQWRTEVKELGDLEPRLLKVVLAELRRDLRYRESRARLGFDRRTIYYWAEKEAEFAKVAEEIHNERKLSSASVEYIAEYLFWALPREKRAIEILFAAHEQKILAESGQSTLIDFLHRTDRFAESIPLLLPLVEKRADDLSYRTRLMHAYFRTGKQAELLALLKVTDAYFHEKDRWNEGVLAGLAASCLENKLFTQSVAYYEELIPLHQRTHARRGIGNGRLSSYYSSAAKAYSGLGKTREAVDKASGAVVSWAPNQRQRQHALESLVDVLVAAPDLGAYVAELDKEKLQSAVVRKAIGQAYIRKDKYELAIPQLQLAAELQPNDSEVNDALLKCFDKLGNKEGAIQQLLQSAELSRRDLKLFEKLGQRYDELKRTGEAERAYTSMVEMLPNESEGHALLAEIREKQNRWSDAIAHWERVAKIRSLEPTGLLRLAAAQIHERSWDAATKSLHTLRIQSWPPRFNDVQQQISDLEKKLADEQKK
ncbi:MAG: hypothetical protein K8U57_22780 [Planctomycetes bacterium]|nr:hypothetical protein [Planctomycetota bacterium]